MKHMPEHRYVSHNQLKGVATAGCGGGEITLPEFEWALLETKTGKIYKAFNTDHDNATLALANSDLPFLCSDENNKLSYIPKNEIRQVLPKKGSQKR